MSRDAITTLEVEKVRPYDRALMINVKNLVKILIVGAIFTASVQMFITPVSKPVQQSAETKQKLQEIDELLERGERIIEEADRQLPKKD